MKTLYYVCVSIVVFFLASFLSFYRSQLPPPTVAPSSPPPEPVMPPPEPKPPVIPLLSKPPSSPPQPPVPQPPSVFPVFADALCVVIVGTKASPPINTTVPARRNIANAVLFTPIFSTKPRRYS